MNFTMRELKQYRRCANKGCQRKAIDELVPDPHEYHSGKHITIFGWTLFLYRNKTEYQTDICLDCSIDQTQEPLREAFYAGKEAGYNEASYD